MGDEAAAALTAEVAAVAPVLAQDRLAEVVANTQPEARVRGAAVLADPVALLASFSFCGGGGLV